MSAAQSKSTLAQIADVVAELARRFVAFEGNRIVPVEARVARLEERIAQLEARGAGK